MPPSIRKKLMMLISSNPFLVAKIVVNHLPSHAGSGGHGVNTGAIACATEHFLRRLQHATDRVAGNRIRRTHDQTPDITELDGAV